MFTSLYGFFVSVRPPKIISYVTPEEIGLSYEKVEFKTDDGVGLRGWFIPALDNDAKTIILLHGYPADKGNILPALSFLQKSYNLFLFDFRYLGESGGSYSTAGALEVLDLLSAIKFLKSRGIYEVGVWGFSMGGAVGLMGAVHAPEIRAVVAESSYASLDAIATQLYRIPVLKHPLGYLTMIWARLLFGISDVSPAESSAKLKIPVLLIHSRNDEVVPFSHGVAISEALAGNPRAEIWFGDDLIHGQFNLEYQSRIESFFNKNL